MVLTVNATVDERATLKFFLSEARRSFNVRNGYICEDSKMSQSSGTPYSEDSVPLPAVFATAFESFL